MNYQFLDTPIGTLRLVSDGSQLTRVEFQDQHQLELEDALASDSVLESTVLQLQEYFAGQRSQFDLPLNAGGTEFQQSVWSALARIPFGELRSYRDIAREIGRSKAVRAVGAGMNCNVGAPRSPRESSARTRLLFIGGDFERKAGDQVVSAVKLLRREGDRRLSLTIIGP